MKKVLVTGANGFTGKAFLKALSSPDWDVIPMVRKPCGIKGEVMMDFNSPDFGKKLEALPKVDAVAHIGARIGWDGSTKEELMTPNVLATEYLARWARKQDAYFLFASAAIVCGVKNHFISEQSFIETDTDYALSKWLAEGIIQETGVKHCLLRIGGIFGKNGPEHLGINKAINNALKGDTPVQYGDGKAKRNYIYVNDLALIMVFCLKEKIEGTYLAAGSDIKTIAEMLQQICEVFLPNRNPEKKSGAAGTDQVIIHSPALPQGRLFKEALEDIKKCA